MNKNMKQIGLILILALSISSCNVMKAPEFTGISNIDIKKNKQGKTVLVAYAKYHNPNLLGGKFKIKDVKVFVNDKYFANINSDTYKVPSIKDFEVPLEVDFDASYFKKKGNILEALSSALKNKLKVHYQGKIYYVSHKLNIPYKIDYTQDVKIFE
jgi:hypothetical protein